MKEIRFLRETTTPMGRIEAGKTFPLTVLREFWDMSVINLMVEGGTIEILGGD